MESLKEGTAITKIVRAIEEAQGKKSFGKTREAEAMKNLNFSEYLADDAVSESSCIHAAGRNRDVDCIKKGSVMKDSAGSAGKKKIAGDIIRTEPEHGTGGKDSEHGALVEVEKTGNRVNIKDLPSEERPRERLFRYGVEKLTNAELIALVIGSGSSEGSALAVAEKLLSLDQTGLTHLAECQPEELCAVKGIGESKAAKLAASIELGRRLSVKPPDERYRVRSSADVAELLMKEMRYLKKESFRVLLLNVKNEVLSIDNTATGGLSSANIHPREVFSNAVKKSANSVVLVHNHPSGNPEPSRSDILLTQRLIEAGKIMGINVADHVVIGNGIYKSIFAGYLD